MTAGVHIWEIQAMTEPSGPKHDGYGWRTAIGRVGQTEIRVRGYEIGDLIRNADFATMAFLVSTGELPTESQRRVVDALLVAVCDHSISPSSTVTRYLTASGVPIQVAIAAGMMTFGDIHGGAGQHLAKLLQDAVTQANESGTELKAVAKRIVSEERAAGRRLPGFSHPQHPSGDPRVPALMAVAKDVGVLGEHARLLGEISNALAEILKRRLEVNIDGAMAALISDLGISWRFARAFIAVPRGMGLAAHAVEEEVREPGWRHVPLEVVEYDGPPDRVMPSRTGPY
jgi:citrate synthase/citryl-CoA lyase